jgi:hypothetical protein
MKTLPTLMIYIWALSSVAQICTFYFVISRRHLQTVPLFAVYIALNLCQAAFLAVFYYCFGFASSDSRQLFWTSELITLVAQTLAASELLYRILRPYRGIWGLAWRLIGVSAFIISCYAWASARHDIDWGLMIADRGYHLTFAVATISCLLLIRFYSIPVNPIYQSLLGGFCIFSCAMVAVDTLYRVLFARRLDFSDDFWNYCEVLVFGVVQVVWTVALRRPVPPAGDDPALLPASAYQRLSPEINSRLRSLNDELSKFWRLEMLQP